MENNEMIEVVDTMDTNTNAGFGFGTIVSGLAQLGGLLALCDIAVNKVAKPAIRFVKKKLAARKERNDDGPDIDVANDPID